MTWLVPDSLWWDGRLQTGAALRDGVTAASGELPAGDPRLRLPGTVLPGLGDAHVHSALVDLETLRAGGLAWVWDLGGEPGSLAALAGRHPWMRFAGPFLTAPGGYPSDRAWAPPGSCRVVRSAADAGEAVAEAHAGGASLIKVTAHAGGPMLAPATLGAVVEAAHARELPVVVHAEGAGTVAAAYDAGADLLAHTPWTEELDDALIRACAGRMTWISTLDIHGYGTPTPERATAVANLRRFLGYGGKARYGTDLGNGPLPPAINPREIRALQECGLTPAGIIAAMTSPDHGEPSWIPGGLDLDPARFADSLATARVLGPEVRPRHILRS
ncbi:amidohydrolase family protein [Couchioplanes caeruleus]|uniref:Amidohydrolase n=2 Tax=Couchioplanes caeruleus TaxID=56438 RepID=A0A1K0GL76_9ACTN|nr:amidohydrolase [Couchioplanes caeruleus]OJF13054.1 amidohydrolase [Couchioplanes caeruleus subsp. caeruleus]ROP32933.1 imidazolonepropionase-like amidohydrolase [Couchioplanes caeruleus]